MKLIKEHLDIGVEIWTKESSGYSHKDELLPCKIIGFSESKTSVMINNQADGHCGNSNYYYDKQGSSLGDYNGKGINDRRYILISDIERIAYPNLSKFIGRKVRTLRESLYGGSLVVGEIGTITNMSMINFPSSSGYLATNLFYQKKIWDAFELLPEDYKEETEIKSDIKKDDKGRPLKEFVIGQWYTNPLNSSGKGEYKYARVSGCRINQAVSERYHYNTVRFDAFTNDFEELLIETESNSNTDYDQRMELVIPPAIKTMAKKVEPIQSNPFKVGDEVEFTSLDRDSVPNDLWIGIDGKISLIGRYTIGKSYKVEKIDNTSVLLNNDNYVSYLIPVMLLKKYEEKQEEVLKYFDGTPLVDVKPGWYINNTGQNSKKYVKISHRELQGPSSDNDYYQRVYYDAFTDDFIDIESVKPNYWANENLNRTLIPISDKEIREIKKKNTTSTSVKMYDANTPLKEFKVGEWYKSPGPHLFKKETLDNGDPATYVKVCEVNIETDFSGKYFYNRVRFNQITHDFINIEAIEESVWANGDLDKKATHIDERKIAKIKEESYRPKITEEAGFFPDTSGFDPYIMEEKSTDKFFGIPMKEARSVFYVDPPEEKTQENLLDKYEHQVIKLTKPRTKNKLIIL